MIITATTNRQIVYLLNRDSASTPADSKAHLESSLEDRQAILGAFLNAD
jgi:hypothetical protein